jgi:PAS domain S-box-containing protein
MKEQKKASFLGALLFIIVLGCITIAANRLLLNGFIRIEEQNIQQNANRALEVLQDDIDKIDSVVRDWSAWDDTYKFIQDRNEDYIKNSLALESLQGIKVNIIAYINTSGKITYSNALDWENGKEMPFPEELKKHLILNSRLHSHKSEESIVKGIILLKDAPMLIASRPILTSEKKGPIQGTLIMGRYLDGEETKRLSKLIHLTLNVTKLDTKALPQDVQIASQFLSSEHQIFFRLLNEESMSGYGLINDVYGKPALIAHIKEPRTIYLQGRETIKTFLMIFALILLVMWLLIQRLLNKFFSSQENLQQSEERYRSLVEKANDAIMSLNPDGQIVGWNSYAEKIFGYKAEEIVGESFTKILPHRYHGVQNRFLDKIFGKGKAVLPEKSVDGFGLRKDGTEFPLEQSFSLWMSAHGMLSTVILRDITERKELEEYLESEVAVRTADLLDVNKKLENSIAEINTAKQEADAANAAKSDFLARMSHEIRTPMNGVLGMAELLLNSELSHKQRKLAQTLHNSGETLLCILNDILDFSKIEAGKMTLEHINLNVRDIIEEALELMAERAHSKGVEMLCHVPPDIPVALKGDPVRLRQIFINLIGNAVKFTENGEIVISARPLEITEEDVRLSFSIKDTGIGIGEEQQKSIFDAFVQADNSTKRKYGGTGLGLAIVKQLVELMGGTISLESTPGKGTLFNFTACFKKQMFQYQTVFDQHQLLDGLRILIIDDNATNRIILHEQLTSWGVINECAENARSALAMLHSAAVNGYPYDIAILDMQMPEMDGLELAREIKRDRSIAATKLIMLSSIGLYINIDNAHEVGLEHILTKPVRQSYLYNCLVTIVENINQNICTAQHANAQTMTISEQLNAQILVAEDNVVNQQVLTGMLLHLGCTADMVGDGSTAIQELGRKYYDLVFMDCQMPHMDGFEATRIIRKREQQSAGNGSAARVPIIALTANAMDGARDECLAAGMDGYMAKPFSITELHAVLKTWLPGKINDARAPGEGRQTAPRACDCEKAHREAENDSPIDASTLDNIKAVQQPGKPDLVEKVINLYLNESQSLCKTIHEAVGTGDPQTLSKAAHSLKSSSANVGALKLASLCKELEMLGRSNSTDNAQDIVNQMDIEYQRVIVSLSQTVGAEYAVGTV